MGTEAELLTGLLRKGATKTAEIYRSATAGRKLKSIEQAEKGIEAAKKGGLALAKYKSGRVLGVASKLAGPAFAAMSAVNTYNAYKRGGAPEAGKTALHEGAGWGAYLLPAAIPGVGPWIAGGLAATDAFRTLVQGKEPVTETLLNKYLPDLKPQEDAEDTASNDGDRAVEPAPASYDAQEQTTQMQDYTEYPSDREIKRLQRRQMFKEYARQRGRDILEQNRREMFNQ